MKHLSLRQCVLLMATALLAIGLIGCKRASSTPPATTGSTEQSTATQKNLSQAPIAPQASVSNSVSTGNQANATAANPSPAIPAGFGLAPSGFSSVPAGTAVPAATAHTAEVPKFGLSGRIGPGHFNGHHELVISSRFQAVRAFTVSPDGKYLIAGRRLNSNSGSLQVWDISASRMVSDIFEPMGVSAAAVSADSKLLAYAAGDHSVVLQPLPSGTPARLPGHHLTIRSLVFSTDGKTLLSLGNDKRVIAWDVTRRAYRSETFDEGPSLASCCRFASPDRFWTWSESGHLRWFEIKPDGVHKSQEVQLAKGGRFTVTDGRKLFVSGAGNSLQIVDIQANKELPAKVLTAPAPKQPVPTVNTSANPVRESIISLVSMHVADGSGDLATCWSDGTFTLWKNGDSSKSRSWKLDNTIPTSIASDAKGQVWALHTLKDGILIFDGQSPDPRKWLMEQHSVSSDDVVTARFDSTQKYVVAARNSKEIVLQEIATGRTQRKIVTDQKSDAKVVTSLVANAGGQIVCGTKTGGIEVWKTESSTPQVQNITKSEITALAQTSDGRLLLAGCATGTVTWIDLSHQAAPITRKEHSGAVRAIEISPDGESAVTVGDDKTVCLWNVKKRERTEVLQGHQHLVRTAAYSPDGKWLATGDQGGTVIVWDLALAKQIWSVQAVHNPAAPQQPGTTIRAEGGVSAVAFNSNHSLLAGGTASGFIQTFDLVHRKALSVVYQGEAVGDLAFAEDEASLYVASRSGDVRRWWRAPELPKLLSGHQGQVRFVALDTSGHRAVSGGHDKRLCVWDVEQGTLLMSLANDGEAIVSGAISPDGSRAVTGSFGSGVVFWDLASGKRLSKRYGHQKRVASFAISPDGNRVASGSEDHTVRIWDFVGQKTTQTISLDLPVHSVRFSPDGSKLATCTVDPRGWQVPGRLQLWDVSTGSLLKEFPGHRTLVNDTVFNSDGSELTSCGADGQICRWNIATGQRIHDSYRPHGLSHAGLINQGRHLVLRRFNKGVIIYDAISMQQVSEFDVATNAVGDLQVASRGNRIIAATDEGPIYVWNASHE